MSDANRISPRNNSVGTDDPTNSEESTRSGFVALVGAPNAGKSTLVNSLVGSKVSIVTHKVQTTRTIVRGIAMHRNAQIVFLDTPGIFHPKRNLERAMVDSAWSGARNADISGIILDAATGINEENRSLLRNFKSLGLPKLLILNKIDLLKREKLLELSKSANDLAEFERTFMVSALNGDGVADLLDYLASALKPGPFYYPEDQISDLPLRMLGSEITREKLFLRLHDELPYASTVETSSWEELPDGSIRIEQTVFVERDSQKKIVIGRKGQTLKEISQSARLEISKLIEQKVHLFIFVKVRRNWSNDPERYREIGLEFPNRN